MWADGSNKPKTGSLAILNWKNDCIVPEFIWVKGFEKSYDFLNSTYLIKININFKFNNVENIVYLIYGN